MSKKQSLARYNIIISTLRKHPASYKGIFERLHRESEIQDENLRVSKRTFQRDLKDVRDLYDIDIQFDHSENYYFIDTDYSSEFTERISEAYNIFNAFKIKERLSDKIHFEQRPPRGTGHLFGLLHAIENQLLIRFDYQKFDDESIKARAAKPLALKEYRNRWYVVAEDLKDDIIKTFALDRLTDLDIQKQQFKREEEFEVHDYFENFFGVVSPENKPVETIVLSFTPFQGKYIKSLPLHRSQEILINNEHELRLSLKLVITHDFYMELLSFGDQVKVIAPQSLKKRVRNTATAILNQAH